MRRALFTFLSAVALIATGVVGAVAVGGTGTVDPPPRIAFLANGIVPADALAAGGIAGQLGAPLFTTRSDALEPAAGDGIDAYDPDLVIALGGEVAINQTVLTALSVKTGLPIVTTDNPDDGIVRVGGDTRFETAALVADLLAAYNPAYLPVDATALGALDADKVDGRHAEDFAASGQACDDIQVVTGFDDIGAAVCAAPDGGDADTLDGLDATDFAAADHDHPVNSDSPFLAATEDVGIRAVASYGETVEVFRSGPIAVDLQCVADIDPENVNNDNQQARLLARTTEDGAFMDGDSNHTGPGNGSTYLDTTTEEDSRQIADGITSVPGEPALEFDIDTAFVAGPNGEYIGIDETLAIGLNVYGSDCVVIGVFNHVLLP